MSRTDAHRPRWVWIQDHPGLRVVHHDHRAAPCTLPEGPLPGDLLSWRPGGCWVDLDPEVRLCSCALCSGRLGRRQARRRVRSLERLYSGLARRGADPVVLERLEGRLVEAEDAWW